MGRHSRLQRRTFLKGLGAAMGLPLLEAMLPSSGFAAQSAGLPKRMAFVFVPNGVIVPDWEPKGEGANWQLSPTLEPLAKVKDKVSVCLGLAQDNARAKGDGPGDHARSSAAFLTGAHPVKTGGVDIKVGQSVDQVAAEAFGSATRFASLQLTCERGEESGDLVGEQRDRVGDHHEQIGQQRLPFGLAHRIDRHRLPEGDRG